MRKMKSAVKTMIYLDEPEHTALKRMSKRTGAPMAELIRRAVGEYLKKKGVTP